MLAFRNKKIKDINFENRIVMPPMCMFTAEEDGMVNEFHKVHYGGRAIGGTGLIIVEATGISPEGRITSKDLGIWDDEHIPGLKSLVDFNHSQGGKIGIQLSHAGRKSLTGKKLLAPSPIAYDEDSRRPVELSKEDINGIIEDFIKGAIRADKAGFDLLEIHGAHGYLIHQFLSPISNKRRDAYGGSLENRVRFLREILGNVKKVWPNDKLISLRLSATDYIKGGLNINDTIEIINNVKPFIDIAHISTGGLVPVDIEVYPGYQVQYARKVQNRCNIPTIAVGLIDNIEDINEVLKFVDFVALGRKLLREPHFCINTKYENKLSNSFPKEYERAYR